MKCFHRVHFSVCIYNAIIQGWQSIVSMNVFLFYVITGSHYFLNAYRFKLDVSFNRQILWNNKSHELQRLLYKSLFSLRFSQLNFPHINIID